MDRSSLGRCGHRCSWQAKAGVGSCHLWYRYRMPISSLDRDLAELAAAVRLDGTLAALAGRASIGDAYMLGMLVSGMTVYGRTTSPVKSFARINEEHAKMIARGRAHGAESWSDQEIRKAIEDDDTTVTLADATVFPPGSPRYEVPLLRIRLAQVAGWWLIPRKRRRRQGVVHAPVGWLTRGFRRPPSEATRSTARPLSTPVPHWRCPMLAPGIRRPSSSIPTATSSTSSTAPASAYLNRAFVKVGG